MTNRLVMNSWQVLIIVLVVKFTVTERILDNFNVPDYTMVQTSIDALVNSTCRDDLLLFIKGLNTQEKWAMTMFDASVKFPFGLLHGNAYQLGNFDECIEVTAEDTKANFSGQYCLAEISMNMNKYFVNLTEQEVYENRELTYRKTANKMHWALCLPSTCSETETETLVTQIFQQTLPVHAHQVLQIIVGKNDCYYRQDFTWAPGQVIYIGILALFFFITLVCTCYHIVLLLKRHLLIGPGMTRTMESLGLVHQLIITFSAVRNTQKLLAINVRLNDFRLDCIVGIRAIAMVIVLAGHALTFQVSAPLMNRKYTETAITIPANGLFLNASLMVDTFLLINGFLMCRLLLIELEKYNRGGCFRVLYSSRVLRSTPAYIVVLGFYCTILADVGEGPLWRKRMLVEQQRCIASWWTNLLYINNYVSNDQMCMFQSWFLSIDMQLFLLAPSVVLLLWRQQIVGEVLLGTLCIISSIVPFMITCSQHLDPTLMIYPSEVNDLSENYYFKNYYVKTHMRANAYFMGLLFGYIVHKMQLKKRKIPFVVNILFNTFAVVASVASVIAVVVFYQPTYVYSALEAALYATLHRVAWSVANGWLLISCITSGSYLNAILSWRLWGPLNRLSYCAYLINGFVELYAYGQTRTARYLSTFNLLLEAAAHILVTLVGAFVLCVLFESPIHRLEKLLFDMPAAEFTLPVITTETERRDNIVRRTTTNHRH